MRELIRDLIPHAPELGLYVAPDIPADRLRNALRDYAPDIAAEDVIALYDATLLRNAKDGAVFTTDRFVFQNNDLEAPQTVKYADLISVEAAKKLLGGRRIQLGVNRGRATLELSIDFSGRPAAARYIAEFLSDAMMAGVTLGRETGSAGVIPGPGALTEEAFENGSAEPVETDLSAVRAALRKMHADGVLSSADLRRLLDALG